MKNLIATCIVIALFTNFAQAQLPTLTKKEIKQGWVLLFDGKTSTGWKSYRAGRPFPEKGWVIENGVLTIAPEGNSDDIITEELFSNFELSLEFRVTKKANSGIKYFILPGTNLGCEFQIYDDESLTEAQRANGTQLQGALYDVIAPKGVKNKPVGEWNHARIIANGAHVEHWLNGKKVVEFERGSDAFKAMVAKSKFKNDEKWSTPTQTPILLQDHGGVASFRNIKIRRLP